MFERTITRAISRLGLDQRGTDPLASVREGAVRLISRNGHSFTHLFGPVTDALRGLPMSIVLDGEVICVNDAGRPDFEALQARLRPRNGQRTCLS